MMMTLPLWATLALALWLFAAAGVLLWARRSIVRTRAGNDRLREIVERYEREEASRLFASINYTPDRPCSCGASIFAVSPGGIVVCKRCGRVSELPTREESC